MARLSRSDLTGKAQSVLGVMDPAAIGKTLMHEHLIWDIRPSALAAAMDQGPAITLCNCWKMTYGRVKVPRNLVSRSTELAISEVKEMVAIGGETVVELLSGGLKPEPAELAKVAKATGANISMGCGQYFKEYQDVERQNRSADDFAADMVDQIFEGAWASDVRAGMIG